MPSIESDLRAFFDGRIEAGSLADAYEPSLIGRHMAEASADDEPTLVKRLYALADHYIASGKYGEGLVMVDAFLSAGKHKPKIDAEAWLLGSEFHAYRSRFEEALKYLENARENAENAGDTEKLLRIHTDATAFLKRLGDFGQARVEAERGLELAGSGDFPKWRMRLWHNLGLVLKDIGDYPGAIDALRKSVELAKELDDRKIIAAGLVNIGTLYHRIKRNKEAIEFMRRAKDAWELLEEDHEVARCLNNLGNYTLEDDPKQAMQFLEDALKRSVDGKYSDVEMTVHFSYGRIHYQEGRFEDARGEFRHSRAFAGTLGDDEYIWRSDWELGRIDLKEGKAAEAKRILAGAAEVLSETRRKLTSDADRVNFLANRESLFGDLVEADLALGDTIAVISDIQRVKALALYELMTGRDVPVINKDMLESLAGDFGRLGIVAADYFIIKDKLVIGLLSRFGVELREIDFDHKAFKKSLGALRDKIKAYEISESLRSRPVTTDANTDAELEKLYGMIISPIEDRLDGALHLAIIPHGPIGSLPFCALKAGAGYLAERCNVSLSPNLSVAARLVSLGAVDVKSLSMAYVQGQSDDLKATDAEAEAVKKMFPGTVREVPAEKLESLASAGGDWLHYSGHAIFTDEAGTEPAIEVSDGERIPFSMQGSNVPKVAVLSACQTGLGTMRGYSETLSLARTLFAGGGRAIVAALWQVADMQTAELMSDFYGGLAKARSVASALADAQRKAISKGWHPYFWAAFCCSGDVIFESAGGTGEINDKT